MNDNRGDTMKDIEVDWYLNHAGRPLVTLSTGSGRSTTLTTEQAMELAAELMKAVAESMAPNAAQVNAERAS